MGGAERFRDHFVDDAELHEIVGGELESLGRLVSELDALPEDPGAAFGADDGIVGELQNADVVANSQTERPAGPPFTNHDANDRYGQHRHFAKVDGDRISLAAFFGSDAWVGAGGVDQADDGNLELGGQFHFLERFPVSFRMSTAVKAFVAFFQIAAFVLADEQDFAIVDFGKSHVDRSIVSESPVTVQFDEFVAKQFDIIASLRAILMASHPDECRCNIYTISQTSYGQ